MKDLGLTLIPPIAVLMLRAIHGSCRVRHFGSERLRELESAGSKYILAFWHGHMLLMMFSKFGRPMTVLSSQHRDAELVVRTLRYFRVTAVRGSSTRGGSEALREMIRLARTTNFAITPDGPRGPRHIAQQGVVALASMSGHHIVPTVIISEKKKTLRSWDRFEVPKPFSRVLYVYGEPIAVPRKPGEGEMEKHRLRVQEAICGLVRDSEARFAELYQQGIR